MYIILPDLPNFSLFFLWSRKKERTFVVELLMQSIPQFAIDRNLEYIMNSLQTLKLK